jgi:hypothetical protein
MPVRFEYYLLALTQSACLFQTSTLAKKWLLPSSWHFSILAPLAASKRWID